MKINISSCLIVKNEDKFLDKCLESIKIFSDEIIVVDTGSIDKTVEIAKKYTDKIFHSNWENDFSKARNYSISLAKNDWVFVIDGDEYLDVKMQENMVNLINNFDFKDVNVFSFKIMNPHPQKKEIEIFYRDTLIDKSKNIFFVKPIHQYIDGYCVIRDKLDIEIINNKNYRDKKVAKEKLQNYFNIMINEIDNSKNDFDKAHFLKHLIWDYQEASMLDDALKTSYILYDLYQKIDYSRSSLDYYDLILRMVIIEYEKSNYHRSLSFTEEILKFFPNSLELFSYNALSKFKLGRKNEIDKMLPILLIEMMKYPNMISLVDKIKKDMFG